MAESGLAVVVIGAGPVGLAAAAHLIAAGEEPLVLEAGAAVGASVRQWGHVRLFSPWSYNVDQAAAALLERHGWIRPPANDYPTGQELVDRYLEPLAGLPELAGRIQSGARVRFVTRAGHDLMKTNGRDDAPFVVRVGGAGRERDILARAVIDASGTWARPNPLGAAGIPAIGEAEAADRIFYGIPDVLGGDRSLIDPNIHSCGTVRPHGAAELAHPENNFYIVGMKSYGRAPTAVMLTGYEQVRSVVAALSGDWEAARRVELVLPETGVCSWRPPENAATPAAIDQPKVAAAASCCG